MKKILTGLSILCISVIAIAGGNPEQVKLPDNYASEYTQYDTRNRSNGKQVGVLYANSTATSSASDAALADGSTIVMEIYKTVAGEDGKPVHAADGVYEKGKFAAIAVMERRSNWDASFDASQRVGDWGFAIYKTDGSVKDNDLDCASCHIPLPDQDFLFSYSSLKDSAKK
jgi:hypothetical protein